MRSRRRRKRNWGILPAVLVLMAVLAVSWWKYPRDGAQRATENNSLAAVPVRELAFDFPGGTQAEPATLTPASAAPTPNPAPADPKPEEPKPATPVETTSTASATSPAAPPIVAPAAAPASNALLDEGRQALARGDYVAARQSLNKALAAGLDEATARQVRDDLSKISAETVFSARILPGDTLATRYIIKPGDSLAKIAMQHSVTADLLASINGIEDKNRIREGQTLKVINGPMRAVVHKRAYRIDVFAGEVFLRSFPVGLGLDDSTPTGDWKVKNKLENPTYYPPRGGAIVSADDPANPLGERWIGLEGISGEALSQERYGIHGTNEPDSIGKSVSLGCVRLNNADVEQVYKYLVEGKSTVTIIE